MKVIELVEKDSTGGSKYRWRMWNGSIEETPWYLNNEYYITYIFKPLEEE